MVGNVGVGYGCMGIVEGDFILDVWEKILI